MQKISSGISGLDNLIDFIYPGDNVVLKVYRRKDNLFLKALKLSRRKNRDAFENFQVYVVLVPSNSSVKGHFLTKKEKTGITKEVRRLSFYS